MKIVHISLRGPYTDNWGYQENILPRIQKKLGNDVTLIVECRKYTSNGKIVETESGRYTLDDGIEVIRIKPDNKYMIRSLNNMLKPYPLFSLLKELKPDLIFVHCLGYGEYLNDIYRYKKKIDPECTLLTDTHEYDSISSPLPTGWKGKLIFKYNINQWRKMYPLYDTVFGITPECIDFAIKYRCAPKDKMKLLPLGYDPGLCNWEKRELIRSEFRKKHSIPKESIVIIHGGKIEKRRKTPETIEAVRRLNNPKVKLVIFGGIADYMKQEVEELLEKNKDFVIYLGQLSPENYYNAYLASDIALFPGGQSVLWQEAIGCGLPLVVGYAKGIEYLDCGGNIKFIKDISAEGITHVLKNVITNDTYKKMIEVAKTSGRDFFSYERISNLITDRVKEH